MMPAVLITFLFSLNLVRQQACIQMVTVTISSASAKALKVSSKLGNTHFEMEV